MIWLSINVHHCAVFVNDWLLLCYCTVGLRVVDSFKILEKKKCVTGIHQLQILDILTPLWTKQEILLIDRMVL